MSAPATSTFTATTPVSPILASSPMATTSSSESRVGSVEVVGQSSTLGRGEELTFSTIERIVEPTGSGNKDQTTKDSIQQPLSTPSPISSSGEDSAFLMTTNDNEIFPQANCNEDQTDAAIKANTSNHGDSAAESSTASTLASTSQQGLFNSLSIPEPVQQVPLQITSAAIASTSTVTVTVTKGKVMVPQLDSITARNLFAIDYMRQHPTTTFTEFGNIWKHLDSETRNKYDTTSKEKFIEKKKSQKK